jgi:hypothetical protein
MLVNVLHTVARKTLLAIQLREAVQGKRWFMARWQASTHLEIQYGVWGHMPRKRKVSVQSFPFVAALTWLIHFS